MSDFDPRFDPAFQPGYDPAKHGSPRPRVQPERQTQQQSDAFAPAPGVTRAADPQPLEAPAAAAPAASASGRNPLVITLWVLSALLFVAGVYGLRLISDRVAMLASNGDFGGSEYYLLQAYTVISPLLIALGLATAIGTLFLLAARRR